MAIATGVVTHPFFLFTVMSILVFRSLGGDGIIRYGDFFFPLNANYAFTWSLGQLGQDSTNQLWYLPLAAFADGLSRLTSQWFASRVLYVLPYFTLGASAYLLSNEVLEGRNKRLGTTISMLFAAFNPLIIEYTMGGTIDALIIPFSTCIAVVGLFLRSLRKRDVRLVMVMGILSIFLMHPLVIALTIVLLLSYGIFNCLYSHDKSIVKFTVKALAIFGVVSFLINSYWAIPLIYNAASSNVLSSTLGVGAGINQVNSIAISNNFEFLDPLMLVTFISIHGFWLFVGIQVLIILLVCLAFVTLFFPGRTKFDIFFAIVGIAGLGFASGPSGPIGALWMDVWNNVPIFHIFRSFTRFNLLTMLAYSMLLGSFAVKLSTWRSTPRDEQTPRATEKTRSLRKIVLGVLLISMILVTSWPLASGMLGGRTALNAPHFPSDYYQVRQMVSQNMSDGSVLSLPILDYPFYTWINPNGTLTNRDLSATILDDDFFGGVTLFTASSPLDTTVMTYLHDNGDPSLVHSALPQLGALNIQYVLLHKDLRVVDSNTGLVSSQPIAQTEAQLEIQLNDSNSLLRVFHGKYLSLYKVEEKVAFPRVFVTSDTSLSYSDFLRAAAATSLAQSPAEFKMSSPVEYHIHFSNAGQAILVLAQNFNAGWRAYYGNVSSGGLGTFFTSQISPSNHILVAGYANGWNITQSGPTSITLLYYPQLLFSAGLILSAIFGGGIIAALCLSYLRSRRRNGVQ